MRLITIRTPKGLGQRVAEIAFRQGISEVGFHDAKALNANQQTTEHDVVQIETAAPKAKGLIEELMDAPFYDPGSFRFTLSQPQSIFASEPPREETYPVVRPTTDVYQEMWQFTTVTVSLVGRVFLSALLLAYGMREDFVPLIIAGLLFLPYHHHMLGIGLGASIREWRFFRQGLLALLVTTFCILGAGICIALMMGPSVKFTEFHAPAHISFLLSVVIGIAAALGAVDDAGRRELIGLAATAHISVYPAWFGMKLIYGFEPADTPLEFLWVFLLDVTALTVAAGITFRVMKMHGAGIRRFIREKSSTATEMV